VVWHVDPESVRAIEAIDFQPYFGLGCVTFRVARALHQPNADDTRSRNRHQKTGVGFWRQFFTPVAKISGTETNMNK